MRGSKYLVFLARPRVETTKADKLSGVHVCCAHAQVDKIESKNKTETMID
jgi:hypothetical protein